MPTGCLYRHIRLDKNEPFYIGISTNKYRPSRKSRKNKIWNYIISKTDYKVEILFNNLPMEILIQKEKEYIKLYGKICDGTGILANLTDGGEGTLGSRHNLGKKHSQETKDKISNKRKGVCNNYNENLRIPIIEYDKNMNFIREHESIKSTKLFGFDPGTVVKCVKGNRKTHKNSIFKYKIN